MALLTLDMQELCGYLGLGKSYEANPGPRLHADALNIWCEMYDAKSCMQHIDLESPCITTVGCTASMFCPH